MPPRDDEEISEEEDEDFTGEGHESDTSPKKRKKRKASAFVDDAASEDEDDDDEADQDFDAGAKRRQKRNRFIDDIAAVDEDEEDDDEEDGVDDLIGDEADEVADHQENIGLYNQVNRAQEEDINPEELDRYIKERFASRPQYAAAEDYQDTGTVSQQGLLPTHQDPKLWLVETRTGQEREACIRLMQKSIDLARGGAPLAIKSCFVQDHLQGYMYVEAYKEAHVMEAIRGLRNVLVSKGAKLVPLSEMVEAITVNTKAKKAMDVGSWVRMRRWPHQGDPAKVLDVEQASQRAEIRFVPRLDYMEMSQRATANLGEEGQRKKQTKKIAGVKPPARLFSKQEAERHGCQPYQKGNFGNRIVVPGHGEFEDGYEVKWVSMRNIVLDEIGPTVEELTRYNQVAIAAKKQKDLGDGVTDSEAAELLTSVGLADQVTFVKGDKVKVIEGDLQGLWGYVHAVRDDNTIEMMPQLKELTEVLPFPPSQLAKTFEVGDHVTVTGGQHSGQTGMVVHAEDKVCTLVSDTTKQELNCFTKDLSERAEVQLGLDTFGQYELHDLVVLEQQTTGVIISVGKDTCKVLTTEGTADNPKIRICKQPDIKRKFPNNRKFTAPDANGNSISVGDLVNVKDGQFAGRSGTVKYVIRGSVFIQSRQITQNSGFMSLRSRAVLVKGAQANNSMARIDPFASLKSPAPHRIAELTGNGGPILASPMRQGGYGGYGGGGYGAGGPGRGGGRGPAGGHGMSMNGRDRIVGKSITIAKGPYKGYKGRVTNATETHVRMELEAQYKTVTVPRTVLPMADGGVPESVSNRRQAYNPPATPGFNAPQTPGYAMGSQTPMHSWAGSRTPRHPGHTPSHPGMATPMHDSAWAAGPTPRHPSSDDQYRDIGTPYTPADTPGTGQVGTPALDPGMTFSYPTAATPGLDQRTPGTAGPYMPSPHVSAPTPGGGGMTASYANPGLHNDVTKARRYTSLVVTIPSQASAPGWVRSVDAGGKLIVELGHLQAGDDTFVRDNSHTITVNPTDVLPMRPRKNDRLRILEGPEAGSEGSLSGIKDGHEAIVKLSQKSTGQEDLVIVLLSSTGRLQ